METIEWSKVKPEDSLLVSVIVMGVLQKSKTTKEEFEKWECKTNVVEIFHWESREYLDLEEVAKNFDDWDLDQNAEMVAEWQIDTLMSLAELVTISEQFYDCIDVEERPTNEWFFNILPLLNGIVECVENFSGGETMP